MVNISTELGSISITSEVFTNIGRRSGHKLLRRKRHGRTQ